MTYPIPNYTRVWVRGRIIDLGKAALQEDNYGLALPVTFSPSPKVLLNAGTGQIISTASFKITPAAQDGYFAIQLPATDDPDINPTNFTYSVKEPTGRSYNIVVPAATPPLNSPGDPLHGQPVLDLITVVPSPPAGAGSVQLLTGLPGRGIASTDNVAGDLVITYTDSTTQNLGPVSGGASSLTELTDVVTTGAAVGQLLAVTQASGGALGEVGLSDPLAVSVTRDAVTGLVGSVTQGGFTETYTRDTLGRVATITRGGVVYTVTRDSAGRVEGISA